MSKLQKLVEKLSKEFSDDDLGRILKNIPRILTDDSKLLIGFKKAEDQADWVAAQLKIIGDKNSPSSWEKLDGIIDLAVKTEKEWHKKVMKTKSISELFDLIKNWGGRRRGYAFERWLKLNKSHSHIPSHHKLPDSWTAITKLENSGFHTATKIRRPDRLYAKMSGGRMWDYKAHKPTTNLFTPGFKSQLDDYLHIIRKEPDIKGINYLFLSKETAEKNLEKISDYVKKLYLHDANYAPIYIVDESTGSAVPLKERMSFLNQKENILLKDRVYISPENKKHYSREIENIILT